MVKRYNISDVFALAATQIADRAQGRAGVRAAWPANDPQLTRTERIALQKRMKELGHPVNDFEGRMTSTCATRSGWSRRSTGWCRTGIRHGS